MGNRTVAKLLGTRNSVSAKVVQRHSDADLRQQLVVPSEEEELIQAKHDPVQKSRPLVLRHPLKPNREILHDASFSTRQTGAMKAIAMDAAFQEKIRRALLAFASDVLSGQELIDKKVEIKAMAWTLDPDTTANNPAQADASGIKLWFYHPNWYHPDGAPRVEFIKSTMLHEGMHFISKDHAGFQSVGQKFDELSANDTLDEAVTEKISAELAGKVLDSSEAYTTSYWNIGGRKGHDFHLTFQGLEKLASGESKLWLGELIPLITKATGLDWNDIKAAYISKDAARHDDVIQKIEAKRGEVMAEWNTSKAAALKQQLGADGIPKDEWETTLKAAIAAVEARVGDQDSTERTKEEIKAEIDAELATLTGAPHEIVTKQDSRSSSVDDWRTVRDNTRKLDPPDKKRKASVWTETTSQATGGSMGKLMGKARSDVVAQEAAKNPHTGPYKASVIPDLRLGEHVARANRLLGYVTKEHPMGWVIVPPAPALQGDTPFSRYPRLATTLLQPANRGESLNSLTGSPPKKSAHDIVGGFGGAGYETNGDVGMINLEHVNLAAVVHEMGHHKQKYEKGFSEENVNQVKGVFPILDLHNILFSENKLAAQELRSKPDSDPFVRLRYTETPVRMKVSQWEEVAKGHVEGENYKRFKARLQVKGGPVFAILQAIEEELANNPDLYPGDVPALFKNLMIKEISMKTKEVEPTDAAK